MLVFTYGHISFLVRITRLCSMKLGFRKLKAEVPSGVFCDFLITSGSLAHYAWWKSSVNKLTLGVARGVANFKQHVMNPAALILAKSLTQRQRSPKIRIEHSRSGCKITIPQNDRILDVNSSFLIQLSSQNLLLISGLMSLFF